MGAWDVAAFPHDLQHERDSRSRRSPSSLHWEDLFNLKLIPSPEKGAPPEVHELTHIHYERAQTHLLVGGDATVEFGQSPSDPLHIFEPLEMVAAFYVKQDVELPMGRVIHRYR